MSVAGKEQKERSHSSAVASGSHAGERWKAVRLRMLPAVVIVAAGAAAYLNSTKGAFVYDDVPSIRDNWHIRSLRPLSGAISLPMWRSGHTVDRRPVLSLSYALNHALLGPAPWGYHAGNIAIHLAAGLLLFGLVRRTLLLPAFAERFRPGAVWFALATAMIWVVHPLQTAAVTYLSQRAESLMGMFLLLTLYCAVRGFQAANGRWWYAAAVASCGLGMASKEVMAAAPLIVLLYDFTFVTGSLKASLRRRWGLYAALAATWLILAGLLAATLRDDVQNDFTARSPLRYALTQPGVVLYYLRLSVCPWPLTMDYDWPYADSAMKIIAPGLAIAALVVLTGWGLYRRRWWGFLGAWFFLILGPSSSFAALTQRIQEHRMYLSLAAAVVLAAVGGRYALRKCLAAASGRSQRLYAAATAALVLAVVGTFAYMTHERNRAYHSDVTLWCDTVEKQPGSFIGHFNLGNALKDSGQIDRAMEEYRVALAIDPQRGDARNNLGVALTIKGQQQKALGGNSDKAATYFREAIAQFRKALEITPRFSGAHVGLGNVLMSLGKVDEAIGHYRTATEISPADEWAHASLGAAFVRHRPGQIDDAVRHLRRAIEINPTHADVHAGLALALAAKGETRQARDHIAKAVELSPKNAEYRAVLGGILLQQGHLKAAVEQFNLAVEIDGNNPEALNNLAWLLATRGSLAGDNAGRAVELAKRAVELTGQENPSLLDTLAAAYAASGLFDQAVATASRAIELARSSGNERLVRELEGRLALYKAGKPFTER